MTFSFVIQLLIFENIDMFSLRNMKSKEKELIRTVNNQEKEIEEKRKAAASLSDPKERERFAREKYHFKKPHEKVFILSNE